MGRIDAYEFVTIRQAAKLAGASEYSLRQMYKAAVLPGYSNINGTKFHVNLEALKIQLGCTQPTERDA